MPKDIQKGMERLTIQSNSKTKTKTRKPRPAYKNERWMYGFHLKNRYLRQISEEYGLPWQTNPMRALFRIQGHLRVTTRLPYTFRSTRYRGRLAKFIIFVEDDGRKRLSLNKFTEAQMDKVRAAMFLPEGTKPKWYECYVDREDKADLSSEDEDMPPLKLSKSLPTASLSQIPDRSDEDGEDSDTFDGDIFSDSDSYYETDEDEWNFGNSEGSEGKVS